jgi:hypothetical protein
MKTIHIRLENTDTVQRTGTVYFRFDNAPLWSVADVTLSPRLCGYVKNFGKIKKELLLNNQSYEHYEFIADINSSVFTDCPFRLQEFTPFENATGKIPHNFKLYMVDEEWQLTRDVVTDKIIAYKELIKRVNRWIRFEEIETYKALDQFDGRYILPNLRFIKA